MREIWLVLGALLGLELATLIAVRLFRGGFQWLITRADENPPLNREKLEKWFGQGFDPELGWVRKPGTTGQERGKHGTITFTVDEHGSRNTPCPVGAPTTVAAYGDSYVFCRQVADHETWPVFLSESLGEGVLNFGVGNYGVDQALIRYTRTELPGSVKVVIMGFVPETICRVQSYWKHYLEFGNTFAFKPRFSLQQGELILHENLMRELADFDTVSEKLPLIQAHDVFYQSKFRRVQFRFPYLLSFLRNARRNAVLFWRLFRRALARRLGRTSVDVENAPFGWIMTCNVLDAHAEYRKSEAAALLRALLLRFRDEARARGHIPLVLVMPQLIDLKLTRSREPTYVPFFKDLEGEVAVLDCTERLQQASDQDELYAEDVYGGHFSKAGNHLVAHWVHCEIEALTNTSA